MVSRTRSALETCRISRDIIESGGDEAMSIERWEMLLSTRADSYLLKIRGRAKTSKNRASAPRRLWEVQEITDDTFSGPYLLWTRL